MRGGSLCDKSACLLYTYWNITATSLRRVLCRPRKQGVPFPSLEGLSIDKWSPFFSKGAYQRAGTPRRAHKATGKHRHAGKALCTSVLLGHLPLLSACEF